MIPKIVSFSGGHTSGLMLSRLRGRTPDFNDQFLTIFENTGKEHDATLDFVHEVETRWGIPIIWLEYTRVPASHISLEAVPEGRKRKNLERQQERGETAHWFKQVDYRSAARRFDKETPFDKLLSWANVLPNVRTRMCSVQMKIRTRDRYLRSIGIREFESFIGIRKDEEHRKLEILANIDQYESPQFPLIEDLTTEADVDAFWDKQPFKLQIPKHMGNCDFCYLKARWKRMALAKSDPNGAQWWNGWEQRKRQGGGEWGWGALSGGRELRGSHRGCQPPRIGTCFPRRRRSMFVRDRRVSAQG